MIHSMAAHVAIGEIPLIIADFVRGSGMGILSYIFKY
jgi:hypothetical protein